MQTIRVNDSLTLDQPNVSAPEKSRRMAFGARGGEHITILNGRANAFEGGGEDPELSLKWAPAGAADYLIGRTVMRVCGRAQLLLNCGQSYRLRLSQESETFVLFWTRGLANAAWQAFSSCGEAFPEIPAVSGRSHGALEHTLAALRAEASSEEPKEEALRERSLAVLAEAAVLAAERRGSLARIPALKRATREELLRRMARAESYLLDCTRATLQGAADAAALSPFHLLRVFHAVHHETPLAWAAGKRLESARTALIMTRDSIEEIARRAGYESRNAFDRAFRRRFGRPPGQVRSMR